IERLPLLRPRPRGLERQNQGVGGRRVVRVLLGDRQHLPRDRHPPVQAGLHHLVPVLFGLGGGVLLGELPVRGGQFVTEREEPLGRRRRFRVVGPRRGQRGQEYDRPGPARGAVHRQVLFGKTGAGGDPAPAASLLRRLRLLEQLLDRRV